MLWITLLLFCAEDRAALTLQANSTQILQRDNLLLSVVLTIKSESAITVFSHGGGQRFHIELQENDKWVLVGLPQGTFGATGGLLLPGKSTFAEYKALHLRKGGFLFESPGEYRLRAIAKMPWGDIASETVNIIVKDRNEADLKKIEEAKTNLGHLAHGVESPMRANVLALESVGGNIGLTIHDRRMTRTLALGEPWKGESVAKEKVCDWLRKKMDPVSCQHALIQLGIFYIEKKDWDGVFRVSNALEHDTPYRRVLIHELELLRNPPPPEMP